MEAKPDLCFVDNISKTIFVIEGKITPKLEEGRKQNINNKKIF